MAIPSIPSYSIPEPADFPVNKVNWQIVPSRAVLLVHDMQEYFMRFYGEGSPMATHLVARMVSLRNWARQWGIPVVYTAQPWEQSSVDRALLNDMWGPGLTAADPALQPVVAELTPEEGDTVLTKWRYSAFQRSPLEDLMRQWRRDQLLICGVYAHIGCLMTATEAFMRDVQAFMVGDAVGDFSEDEHRMALKYVAGRCGRVVSCQDVTALQPVQLSLAWLKEQVLPRLAEPVDDLDADDNLMDYGLDSVQVMAMVANWVQLGLTVRFEDLARKPTLNGWLRALSAQQETGKNLRAAA